MPDVCCKFRTKGCCHVRRSVCYARSAASSATPLFIIGNLAVGIWARVPRPYDVTAWKAAASAANAAEPVAFVPLGVVGEAGTARRPLLAPPETDRSPTFQADVGGAGTIEIALPNGVRICVAGLVSQKCCRGFCARCGYAVISLAAGTKVFLACRPVDLRNRWFGGEGAASKRCRPIQRSFFHFPQKRGDTISRVCIGTAAGCG